jgi:hypothetical protein
VSQTRAEYRDQWKAKRKLIAELRQIAKADRALQASHKVWYLPLGTDREAINLLDSATAKWTHKGVL